MSVCRNPYLVFDSRPGLGRLRRAVLALALLVLFGATPSCASSGKDAARGPGGKKMLLTPAELQIKIRSLADPFSGAIEEAVEELSATNDDPEFRLRLLMWQINVVNALQKATFQPRPLAALFDTWALVEQLRIYSETGPGSAFPLELRQIVLNAVEGMEAELLKIATEAGGQEGAADAQRLIREWAAENPIDRFVVRASTESELARWTARGNMGAMATVKSLGASLDDVMARLDLYSEYVPKQAAWHAELVAGRLVEPSRVDRAFENMGLTADAFDRIALSLENYPNVVADERRIILETIQEERAIILDQLLGKFAEIQIFINEERIDLVEHQLRLEREAIFEAIAGERAIIIDAAIKERADTMVELEEMVGDLVERSAIKVVDHFFVRAVQLLAILLVGLALIAVVVGLLWKRK
jgi:hypothetical protein